MKNYEEFIAAINHLFKSEFYTKKASLLILLIDGVELEWRRVNMARYTTDGVDLQYASHAKNVEAMYRAYSAGLTRLSSNAK